MRWYVLPAVLEFAYMLALRRYCKGVGSTPAEKPIADGDFFSTVPTLNFDMSMISIRIKTHLVFRNNSTSSEVPQNGNGFNFNLYHMPFQ